MIKRILQRHSLDFLIQSNGGDISFHIWRTGELFVSVMESQINPEVCFYPNPASSEITVEWSDQLFSGSELSIFTVCGKEIHRQVMPQHQITNKVDISFLREGIYIFRVVSSLGLISTRKVLIQR